MAAKCPQCGKELENSRNRYRPFCSEHCKLIDLGNWLSGTYRIAPKSIDEEEDGQMPSPDDLEKE
jgi:endogenous inhibitor of DNA gyrase (YacG/DUF329 family)